MPIPLLFPDRRRRKAAPAATATTATATATMVSVLCPCRKSMAARCLAPYATARRKSVGGFGWAAGVQWGVDFRGGEAERGGRCGRVGLSVCAGRKGGRNGWRRRSRGLRIARFALVVNYYYLMFQTVIRLIFFNSKFNRSSYSKICLNIIKLKSFSMILC